MKTPQEALRQWVLGRIRFKIGNRTFLQKDHFLDVVDSINQQDWGISLSLPRRYKDTKGQVKETRQIVVILDSSDMALRGVREWLKEGNTLTVSFALRFESLNELYWHLHNKGERGIAKLRSELSSL